MVRQTTWNLNRGHKEQKSSALCDIRYKRLRNTHTYLFTYDALVPHSSTIGLPQGIILDI